MRAKQNKTPWLFALLAIILVLVTEQLIEHFAQRSAREQEKAAVSETLSTLRARLEGLVNSNLLLVQGLAAVISAQPDIDQAGFARIARGLVDERHALRNIGGAPDMVIAMVYPLAGNEGAIGLDYRTHPTQGPVARRAMETGRPIVAGPLQLIQGGIGIVAREPVFVPAEQSGGKPRFWGLVSAVIDVDQLYRQAGLNEVDARLQLAIRGVNGTGAQGAVFYGNAAVFAAQPVTKTISLPGGTWQMAAVPAAGWGQPSHTLWMIRLFGVIAALVAATLVFLLSRDRLALAASEAQLRALLNTLPDLVWMKNPEGVYLTCNARFESLYGAGEARIIGKTDYDFVPADMAEFFRANDRAAIAAGGPRANEEWLTFAADGHRELVETIKAPVHDSAGKLIGVLGVARNITQHRQAERALQESETRLRLFIEHAPAALAMFDRDMRYLVVSHRWLTDYHLADVDLLGRCHYDVFPEIDDALKAIHQRGLAGEVIRNEEDLFVRLNGEVQWLRWEVRPWMTQDGSVGGIVVFSEDITERKQAEAQARQGDVLLDSVFQALPDMFFLIDDSGVILDYRASRSSDLYVPPQTFLGKRMQDVVPGELADLFETNMTIIRRDGGMATYEYDLDLPHGKQRFEARLSQFPGGTQFIAVVRDITERTRMENEIRQINAELEERVRQRTAELAAANKELETFTYSVSHDLKAPLRGIDGYSRLLLDDHLAQLDDEGRLFLANVRHGVEQMSELIEDLLAYSRMERRDLHGVPLDLARQVAAVLHERAEEIAAKGAQVDVALDALSARADPDGLAMVLRNLIDNALKFSRDSRPPRLSISATLTEKTIILAIKDNGIGFDMQFQDRIFEIFQRLQRAEDYPGTGVGLAIVRKAMQRMGGRVWATSAPGQGATFQLELPR